MALDPDNVRVALTGAVYTAPKGTEAPTDATSPFGEDWQDLGYLSDDGVEEAYADDVTDIVAWQGGAIVRKVISGTDATFSFTCIETNKTVLELYHKGSTVETTPGLGGDPDVHSMDVKVAQPDRRAFAFDVVDGDEHIRIIIPDGEVTERGAIVYQNAEPIGYELTITAYPDSSGVLCTKLSNSASWAEPAGGGE